MSEVGAIALRLALGIAVLGLGVAVTAGVRRREELTQVAERSLQVVFALTSLAMLGLFSAFANHEYQLAYVAQNSARSMELHYRLAALWGGQAGSLLQWLWMLTANGAACRSRRAHV